LIVCCRKNWLRSTRYWCPTNVGPPDKFFPQRHGQPWR
jgi:hypothetical protein